MLFDANRRLANAESSMVHDNNPDAAGMDGIEGRRERAVHRQRHSHAGEKGINSITSAQAAL